MPHMQTVPKSDVAAISDALTSARKNATPLSEFPGVLPITAADAYAVQIRSIQNWPSRLTGFKVGGIAPAFRKQFGADWLAGAIFEDEVFEIGDGETARADVFDGGFAAYEAEWILIVDEIDWSSLGPITLEEARDRVSALHMGMEIASSPMPMINDLGPGAIISDFGNNSSVWIGPPADLSILERFEDITVRTIIDDQTVGQRATSSGIEGPVGALAFLLDHLQSLRDAIDLPNRLIVSSGAVTGVHDSRIGTTGLIQFDGIGEFSLSMVPKTSISPAP